MTSGGQTKAVDIKVGRQILCREKPNTRSTSACAKKLTATVTAAKKGLTPAQQKLWRKYVYTSALLQAQRFCVNFRYRRHMGAEPQPRPLTKPQIYRKCISEVLSGKKNVKGPFKTQFKWSDFLINGAKMVKKLPVKLGTPQPRIRIPIRGTNPNGPLCKGGRIRINGRCTCPRGLKWIGGRCKKSAPDIFDGMSVVPR